MHRQVGPRDVLELGLDLLLGRIDDDTRPFAEDELLDFDETEHGAMAHLAGVDLVDLPLAHEHDSVQGFLAHSSAGAARARSLPKYTHIDMRHMWSSRYKSRDWRARPQSCFM